MIEIKRTWFGRKVARATLPVDKFTEQMVYRLKDQIAEFVSGMNTTVTMMEERSWRHFVCRDVFLNVDKVSQYSPVLTLPEINFWVIDENYMQTWLNADIFKDFIQRFYGGGVDDAQICAGIAKACEDDPVCSKQLPFPFESITLIVKRLEKDDVIEPESELALSPIQYTTVPDEVFNEIVEGAMDNYLTLREAPTLDALTHVRQTVIESALNYRQNDVVVNAVLGDQPTELKATIIVPVSYLGVQQDFPVDVTYSPDKINIDFNRYSYGVDIDLFILADKRTPKGVSKSNLSECTRATMSKYFPTDKFNSERNYHHTTEEYSTMWNITLVALKGKE